MEHGDPVGALENRTTAERWTRLIDRGPLIRRRRILHGARPDDMVLVPAIELEDKRKSLPVPRSASADTKMRALYFCAGARKPTAGRDPGQLDSAVSR